MSKADLEQQVEALRSEGINVWSISRLNTAHDCPLEYYLTYIAKEPPQQNVYGFLGGVIHEILEEVQNGTKSADQLKPIMCMAIDEANQEGLVFPNEQIKKSWVEDVMLFCDGFKKLEGNFETELGFIFELEGEHIQGFIDCLIHDMEGKAHIMDWKTSSMFERDKLLKAGRQLILYKLGYEDIWKEPVESVSWFMIKYNTIEYNGKKYMKNRRKMVEQTFKHINNQFELQGYSPMIKNLFLDNFTKTGSLESLPESVRNTVSVKDCIMRYNITSDLIDETKTYILNEVKQIRARSNNIEDWPSCNIDKNNFYCQNLCGQKNICPAYRKYLIKG